MKSWHDAKKKKVRVKEKIKRRRIQQKSVFTGSIGSRGHFCMAFEESLERNNMSKRNYTQE